MKRVLLTTFPEAFLHQGGGEREIHLLHDALNNSGIMADIYGPTSLPIQAYDALIHFSLNSGTEQTLGFARNFCNKMILWPNLWFVDEPKPQQLDQLKATINFFDAVVFRSKTEQNHFARYFDLKQKAIINITPLISQKFLRQNVSDVFRETHGLEHYAIWPGIIEPQKNQLAAVRAFRELDMNLVISGRVRDQEYLKQCMSEAGPNTYFIPPMPFGSDLHLSALAHSDLFIELPLDFPGTSAVEAATLGCNLLLTRCAWTDEMFGKQCPQIDPTDEKAIASAVVEAIKIPSQNQKMRTKHAMLENAIETLVYYLNYIK